MFYAGARADASGHVGGSGLGARAVPSGEIADTPPNNFIEKLVRTY